MVDSFYDKPEWKLGHSGEKQVAEWLRLEGWHVIPSYDYSGEDNNKAPKMYGPRCAFVLPDIDISKDGQRKWAEVKTKTSANEYRKTGKLQHGFARRHFQHYRRVQEITGCEVWLFVYEKDTGDVLCIQLDKLDNAREATMEGQVHIFFDRERMHKVANLNEESKAK